MAEHDLEVSIEQVDGFEFTVRFDMDGADDLRVDEPEPLGTGRGPNPSRLVAAAVGNCLAASLYFCLQRSRFDVDGMRARVRGTMTRNDRKRLRIGGFEVEIELPVGADDRPRIERCLGLFEDFCVVTESVRHGVPVAVRVVDRDGSELLASGQAPSS